MSRKRAKHQWPSYDSCRSNRNLWSPPPPAFPLLNNWCSCRKRPGKLPHPWSYPGHFSPQTSTCTWNRPQRPYVLCCPSEEEKIIPNDIRRSAHSKVKLPYRLRNTNVIFQNKMYVWQSFKMEGLIRAACHSKFFTLKKNNNNFERKSTKEGPPPLINATQFPNGYSAHDKFPKKTAWNVESD